MGQLETERMVVSALIKAPELLYGMDLKIEEFRDPDARSIIRGLQEIEAKRISYSFLELMRALPDMSTDTLMRFKEASPYGHNLQAHIQDIKNFIKTDKLENLSMIIKDQITEGLDPMDIIARIELYISSLDSLNHDGTPQPVVAVVSDAITAYEKRLENPGIPGVSTGFLILDKDFGGFQRSKLYYIGARPSQGKTALMLNMFVTIVRNELSAGIISIESTLPEIGSRLLCIAGGIDADDITEGTGKKDGLGELRVKIKSICQSDSVIYHDPHASIGDIEVQVMRMVAKNKVKIVFIDYIQLIEGDVTRKRHEEIAGISRRLKYIASKNNIAIVALAQMKRDVDGRHAGMADFAESSSLEKDADVMMAIDHEIVAEGTGDLARIKENSMIAVLKSRDGRTENCPVEFLRPTLRFRQV